jgi:hypothetical protein
MGTKAQGRKVSKQKDDFGITTSILAPLPRRLRDIETQYVLRSYDRATLHRARTFILKLWELHQRGPVDQSELAALFDTIQLR